MRKLLALVLMLILLSAAVLSGNGYCLSAGTSPVPQTAGSVRLEPSSDAVSEVSESLDSESEDSSVAPPDGLAEKRPATVPINADETVYREWNLPEVIRTQPRELFLYKIIPAKTNIHDVLSPGRVLTVFGANEQERAALAKLETALNEYDKEVSVAAYRLDGKKAFAYNTDATYFAACTVKAGYTLFCCMEIDAGRGSLDDVLVYEKDCFVAGSGTIQNGEYGSKYTVRELITLALNISDNIAYKMLSKKFGSDGYNELMRNLGAASLCHRYKNIWPRETKVQSMLPVWKAIAEYFATGTEASVVMHDACTGSPYSFIARADRRLVYSHKSGGHGGEVKAYHDAAVIWYKDTPYIISVFTASEGEDDTKALYKVIVAASRAFFEAPVNNWHDFSTIQTEEL